MLGVTSFPAPPAQEVVGLSHWMARVRKELSALRSLKTGSSEESQNDAVHDLRVALRRCRSLASAYEEVDPDLRWHRLRKVSRKLFRALGEWRDAQVLAEWSRQLGSDGNPVQLHLLSVLTDRARRAEEAAHRKGRKFDLKEWMELNRALRRRTRVVPLNGPAAQCLVLERLESARNLHARALRTENPKPWHKLRIGVKRFRYAVENLVPQLYPAWRADLKRVQDLLGDLHDLDVLAALLEQESERLAAGASETWRLAIRRKRADRIQTYRQLTLGRTGLWQVWRAGLPSGAEEEAVAMAKECIEGFLEALVKAGQPIPIEEEGASGLSAKVPVTAPQRA